MNGTDAAAPSGPARRKGGERGSARGATGKLFVLDTNVLLHDPASLFRFAEHDVFVPMMVLEELDNNKKGMSELARNARQASRLIDAVISGTPTAAIGRGIGLAQASGGGASGRLFLQTGDNADAAAPGIAPQRPDNRILTLVSHLRSRHAGREVILVSKAINMRIKARALGLETQDYYNDKVLEDTDLLYSGTCALPPDFWETHGKGMESWKRDGRTRYRLHGPLCGRLLVNQFVHLETDPPFEAVVRIRDRESCVIETLTDYRSARHAVWGICARNREQNFALNLLMDPEIDFVTLLGQAGSGKTLLTLAAGLAQTLDDKRYAEIIITRVTVPVGEDIGFLPGTEEEKMTPWMGALEDNLEVLNRGDEESGEWGRAATRDLVRSRIRVKSLNFMRGRTFLGKYLVIDEAQNLTPKQMKTLITRAGPGTKVVCLGNIAQIDTPYLTEGSSGMSYVVDRMKGWAHSGHVTLTRGERSRLADYAAQAL